MKTYQIKNVHDKRKMQRRKLVLSVSILFFALLLTAYAINGNENYEQYNNAPLLSQDKEETTQEKIIEIPTVELSIEPKDFQVLENKKNIAKMSGILLTEPGDEVPGFIKVNGNKSVPVMVRLKGDDIAGQFPNDKKKWPLRVQTLNDKKVFGMSRFSIHKNQTRHGHEEKLLLDYLRKEGIIAPRYIYINLVLNGVDNGIMAIEEHFTKELLESQGRREAPIIAFDEDYFWRQRHLNHLLEQNLFPGNKRDYGALHIDMFTFPFHTFQEEKMWTDSTLQNYYREALGLLRAFRAGEVDQENVFDNKLCAKYLAITHLWNRNHGLLDYNLRFYYNPVTRLFEPISFDNDYLPGFSIPTFYLLGSSEEFHEEYAKTLNQLKKDIDSGLFFKTLDEWENKVYPYIIKEEKDAPRYSKEAFIERLGYLFNNKLGKDDRTRWKEKVKPINFRNAPLIFDYFLLVFCVKDKNGSFLEFQNLTDKEITLDEIFFISKIKNNVEIKNIIPIPDGKKTIPPYLKTRSRIKIPVSKFPLSNKEEYHVIATYDGINFQKDITAMRYFSLLNEIKYVPSEQKQFLKDFPFVDTVIKDDVIIKYIIHKGNWNIDKDMCVPRHIPLIIQPGASLHFKENTRLILRSPLIAKGTEKEPIIFDNEQVNNPLVKYINSNKSWGGIVVLQASKESYLEHVIIKNIGLIKDDTWNLTGAITFYESTVRVINSTIALNRTEDLLNIIRSQFKIEGSSFSDTTSDAIDVDFGSGTIQNSSFKNIMGDAIDISGSKLKASNINIYNITDKGISVGEKSNFTGDNFTITNAGIAIASKDGSIAELQNSTISNIKQFAYMAYIKKPEYQKAELVINNNKTGKVNQLSGAVKPSIIFIDGKMQPFKNIDIDKLYGKDSEIKTVLGSSSLNTIKSTYKSIKTEYDDSVNNKWNEEVTFNIDVDGVTLDLDRIYNNTTFKLTLDYNNNYNVLFYLGNKLVGHQRLKPQRAKDDEIYLFTRNIPEVAINSGYDRIVIYPLKYNKNKSIGKLLLFDSTIDKSL